MSRRRWPLGLAAPAALVVLVGALGTLQYRWVGQLSEAERAQLGASLERRAAEFADDFDRGITRIYHAFMPDPFGFDPDDPARLAAQYGEWRRSAPAAPLVRDLYFADIAVDPVARTTRETLWIFRPAAGRFDRTDWPAHLAPVRARVSTFVQRRESPGGSTIVVASRPIVDDVPALLMPMPGPIRLGSGQLSGATDLVLAVNLRHRFLVVDLDAGYLKSTWLPELSARHFPDTAHYRVAIVDRRGATAFRHGMAAEATIAPDRADASNPLFAIRAEVLRGATFEWMMSAPGGSASALATRSGPAADGASRFSIVVQEDRAARIPAEGGEAAGGAPAGRSPARRVEARARPDPAAPDGASLQAAGGTGWRLLVQHAAGSLDAAVERVRRRNLWLSFGILSVLAMSVALIVANARRSERLAAQQMDFVATVSHELRTPLAVIRSAAQNLSAGVVHEADQAKRYGDLIEAEGRRLTDMVEEVLEYAGAGGSRRQPQPGAVDLQPLVEGVVAACQPLVDASGARVVVDLAPDLPAVALDEADGRRVVANLVTNALKHAGDGQWIGISAARERSGTRDDVALSVTDRGRGIPAEDLPHIFEPFYRGRQAIERQVQGNGLGLSLVKRIAESHGGRVTVRSTPGAGSTFTVSLPVSPEASAGASQPAGAAAARAAGSQSS
jgi:signal transduction histidine kinase